MSTDGSELDFMPYVVETGKAKVSVKEYTERCVDVERFLGFCRECIRIWH